MVKFETHILSSRRMLDVACAARATFKSLRVSHVQLALSRLFCALPQRVSFLRRLISPLRVLKGIPYMFNSPSLLFDLSGKHVTATLPGWGTGMPRRMNLGDRLQNAISPRALSVFLTPAFISMNKVRDVDGGKE